MTLQELARIGGAMGGIGVILGMLYFAMELRHNTRTVRAAAFQQVVNSFAAVSFDIARDKELVTLFVQGGRDFARLGEIERTRYTYMLLSFLRRAENVQFQTDIHMLETEHWSGIRNSIKAVMASPGTRVCWSDIKGRFNPEFRCFVEDLIAEPAIEQPLQDFAALQPAHA